jgi:hypothetical protein
MFSALSIDFLGRPSLTRWLILALAGAAMTGLSTTAFFLLPMLALSLGVASLAAEGWSRGRIAQVAAYGASLWYVVGYALYSSRGARHLLDVSQLPGTWPVTFGGHLAVFLDLQRPVTPAVFFVCLVMGAALTRGRRRRLLLSWTAAAMVLFLNPVVAPFWITHVTSAPIYWRSFYILPLLAVIGVAAIALLERLLAARQWAAGALAGLLLVVCLAANLVPGSTSIYRRGGEIGWPAYKLVDEAVEVSRAVVSLAPPGVMLASREISGTTPMLRGGYPQLRIRDDTLVGWLTGLGRAADADLRIRASEFTVGRTEYLAEFMRLVASTEVLETVVVREDAHPLVETFLSDQAFSHRARSGRYWIHWR